MLENNPQPTTQTSNKSNTILVIIGKLITAAVILAITAFFTPGFQISNIWTLVIAAVALTILDYLIIKLTGLHASPFGKGIVGFILSVAILYITQYFVPGYSISWTAAIIGALIYGIVDYLIPGPQVM